MTITEARRWAQRELVLSSIENAESESLWMLESLCECNRSQLLLEGQKQLDDTKLETYKRLVKKRIEGVPLQYLLGSQSFYGHEFYVTKDVLIPRFETEELVAFIVPYIREHRINHILEIGIGSGCIMISLLLEFKDILGVGVDISPPAIEIATTNATRLGVIDRFDIRLGDCYEPIMNEKFDVIVSNPPYIESHVVETLEPIVKHYEPRLALDGGIDGLDFYRRLVTEGKKHLQPQGLMIFEIGYNQKVALESLFDENGYKDIKTLKDLSGRDRIVMARNL